MGYGTRRGDYLGAYRGDPGFFKSLLKGIGKVAGVFLGGGAPPAQTTFLLPQGYVPPSQRQRAPTLQMGGPYGLVYRQPRAAVKPTRLVGGMRNGIPDSPEYRAYMRAGQKRKRMNVANPKALRRAIRRQAGFVKLAKRALKGSGYTVVSKGSRRPRRAVQITESGPGSVNVR